MRAVLLTLADAVVAVVWMLIGAALLLYPRQIARFYANFLRNRTAGPIRAIARPLARHMEGPFNIWSIRLTGIFWIAGGMIFLYFVIFA